MLTVRLTLVVFSVVWCQVSDGDDSNISNIIHHFNSAILTSQCANLLDEVLGGAPVGDPNNGGSSGTAPGFSVMGGGERNSGSNKAFVGTGQSLGGGSSSAANASSDEREALLDRREKARQAALKRFEQNQN